jgi:hypothetical protein
MRILPALLVALTAVPACTSLAEKLEDQDCFDNTDCARSQTCVVALPSLKTNPGSYYTGSPVFNSSGLGWCQESSECAIGKQPFCRCNPNPTEATCEAGSAVLCDPSDPELDCVPFDDAMGHDAALDDCFCVPY